MACNHKTQGFSLIEILVVITLFALTLVASVTYLLPLRDKASLQQEMDKLTTALEFARQQSIAVYRGFEYGVSINPGSNQAYVIPTNTSVGLKELTIIELEPASANPDIVFAKISGRVESDYQIKVSYKQLEGKILLNQTGLVTQEPIKRK